MNILNTIKTNKAMSYLVASYVASGVACVAISLDHDNTAAAALVLSCAAYYKAVDIEHKRNLEKVDAITTSVRLQTKELRNTLRSTGTIA